MVSGWKQESRLPGLLDLAILLGSSVLVAQLIVSLVELLALLLEVLKVLLLLLELLAQTSNLTGLAGDGELLALLGVLLGALVGAEAVLEAHDLNDHDVGSVEDEREEEGEATEVHVALRVELAGLDFEAFVAHDGSTAGEC